MYSSNLRFIFELIQNVDDCDYLDASDCTLDMHFDFNGNKIILTYNKTGFTTFNVFAITEIAEAAKNVSGKKNEIGEKGIGFKSVFGVANRVLIESGWFSFELYKSNFTIPMPTDSTNYVDGTRMTLYLSGENVRSIYMGIEKQYYGKKSLFSRNPLLFLNKLSRLKIHYDTWDNMEFHVTRSNINSEIESIVREEEVFLSVKLSSRTYSYNGANEIKCIRYTTSVLYNYHACKSRYGEDTKLGLDREKRMELRTVIPYPEFISEIGNGSLYSFLPTQIKFTIPMVCHVPFKLDASREFVDPQNNNLWFSNSCQFLIKLLDYVYNDLKNLFKEKIVYYLCGVRQAIFDNSNEKTRCLSEMSEFSGSHFLDLSLFHVGKNKYCKAEEITVIPSDETDQPILAYELIESRKCLYIPPEGVDVGKFGISISRGVNEIVFEKALSNPEITKKGLDYLCCQKNLTLNLERLKQKGELQLSIDQINEIATHEKILKLFVDENHNAIKKKSRPFWTVQSNNAVDIRTCLDTFEPEDLPSVVSYCFRRSKFSFYSQ